jgi:hypothetical protein
VDASFSVFTAQIRLWQISRSADSMPSIVGAIRSEELHTSRHSQHGFEAIGVRTALLMHPTDDSAVGHLVVLAHHQGPETLFDFCTIQNWAELIVHKVSEMKRRFFVAGQL